MKKNRKASGFITAISITALCLFASLSCVSAGSRPIPSPQPEAPAFSFTDTIIVTDPGLDFCLEAGRKVFLVTRGLPSIHGAKAYNYMQSVLMSAGFSLLEEKDSRLLAEAIRGQMDILFDENEFDRVLSVGTWKPANLLGLLDVSVIARYKSPEGPGSRNYYYSPNSSFKIVDVQENRVLLSAVIIGAESNEQVEEEAMVNYLLKTLKELILDLIQYE